MFFLLFNMQNKAQCALGEPEAVASGDHSCYPVTRAARISEHALDRRKFPMEVNVQTP